MKEGRRTWLEIDMDKIIRNIHAIRKNMKAETALCAIIKADAYGHGARQFARVLDKVDEVDFFGVASSDEALEIRNTGAKKPVLIIGYADPRMAPMLAARNISQCCLSLAHARELSTALKGTLTPLKVHIKIDTGLSRLGLFAQQEKDLQGALTEVLQILALPNLEFEGIFTHFANAYEPDTSFTDHQYDMFMKLVEALKAEGHTFPYVHCNNSPGGSYHPEKQCDMARPGTTLYGYPMDPNRPVAGLVPAMQWKAKVAQIKDLPAGAVISYGCTYEAKEPMRVAVVTAGCADGIFRILQGNMRVLINGQSAPNVGVMCMDLMVVDISHISDVKEGQTVTIFGEDQGAWLYPEEMSSQVNLHPLLMGMYINRRVPRVYFMDGKEIGEANYLLDQA